MPDLLDPCPPFLALDPVNGQSGASLDRTSSSRYDESYRLRVGGFDLPLRTNAVPAAVCKANFRIQDDSGKAEAALGVYQGSAALTTRHFALQALDGLSTPVPGRRPAAAVSASA